MKYLLLLLMIIPVFIQGSIKESGHSIEISFGWENMGISPETTWRPLKPHTQGSRKEMAFDLGWKLIGNTKVFYAPAFQINYGNNWSLSGAMQLLGISISPFGLGVYMTDSPEKRGGFKKGQIYGLFDIQFGSFGFGGNIAPNYGVGVREWSDPYNQFGNQYYAFGKNYAYFHFSTPVTIRFWGMLTDKVGFGMFISSDVIIVEKSLNIDMPVAIGYNMYAGFNILLF